MKSSEFINEASTADEATLKNTKWESPKQIFAWLESNGFAKLGSGNFARVYSKPNDDRIVKASTEQDACWLQFAAWAMKQTNNPHVPKIHWIHQYSKKFFVTIIERLHPLDDEAISRIKDPGVLFGLLEFTDIYIDEDLYDADAFAATIGEQRVKYKNHPFVTTIQQLENLPGNCISDFNAENLMVRRDGTIVITDPIVDDEY